MFFRKKGTKNLTKGGPVWDEKTVKSIAQKVCLDVDITHIRRTISLGDPDNDSDDRFSLGGSTECAVHGVMYDLPGVTYPKFIPVMITFEGRSEFKEHLKALRLQYGGQTSDTKEKTHGWFSYQTSETEPTLEVWLPDRDEQKAQLPFGLLPLLKVGFSDRDEKIAQLLIGALSDAILSGRKCARVRFFKKEGEGLMTPADEEHGYSYQSRYSILGLVTWQELHAGRLPK